MSRAAICVVVAAGAFALAQAALAGGSFQSSDPLLNKIWQVSVQTANDAVVPGPITEDALGRPCPIDLPIVIVDAPVRDRCPYTGDLAVTGLTLEISSPSAIPAVGSMLRYYASRQLSSGAIPASPEGGNDLVLFDYNAYWVQDLYDYVLYSGDIGLARDLWTNLVRLMDGWYPTQMGPAGLLVNSDGLASYSYFPSRQPVVAYFNAQYALALEQAAQIADWLATPSYAARWRSLDTTLQTTFEAAFWDPTSGAYRDSPTGSVVHPQDGNVFAILAGLASRGEATSSLGYLGTANYQAYGNTIADSDSLGNADMGAVLASKVVYPFMGYFEVLARYESGLDAGALGLIRREWGYMVVNGPHQGMWELIGPYGGGPPVGWPSWDHGWSSGAAPALTNYVLGVQPTSPGFATFTVTPHPSDLTSAQGDVPTPHGTIHVSWKLVAGNPVVSVTAPLGTVWANKPAPSAKTLKKPSKHAKTKQRPKISAR